MADTDLIDRIQQSYPRLWHACHVEHRTRGRPHRSGLTDRESGILAHIGLDAVEPGPLARHLGIAKSTLSAHLTRLAGLGLLENTVARGDKRRRLIRLTEAGRASLRADAVLDTGRVAALLAEVPARDRARAVRGLVILAAAAQRLTVRRGQA